MHLTWRLVALFALGMILLLCSWFAHIFIWIAIGLDIALLGLIFTDFLVSPNPRRVFEVARTTAEKMSLGSQNRVNVSLRFIGERVVQPPKVFVRDEPPFEFDITGNATRSVAFSPGLRDQSYFYHLVPHAKGDYKFANTTIKYAGPLGLIARVHTFKTEQQIKVYPNLHEVEKFDLLARRGLLQQLGIKNLRLRGGGSEFESLREYVTGDEYRKIDWSATARRNKLITRQYEVERSQNIILAIDAGRTMLQPIQKMSKLDYVVNTALMLSYVAVQGDDKVGLFVFDAETRIFIPPAKSKAQSYRIMNALYNVSARMVESDYVAAFDDLATRWRRRSLFVLFTDLVDPDSSAGVLNAMTLIEKRHRSICVTVSDPNITTAAAINPETEADVYQKAVAMQTHHERRSAINILKRRGIWSVDSPPASLSADLINRYMELKSRSAI